MSGIAGLCWYTVFVIAVAVAICLGVHYSASYFSEQLRKIIIIVSLFTFLGVTTYTGELKKTH
jgi:uncharacterized membrane protein